MLIIKKVLQKPFKFLCTSFIMIACLNFTENSFSQDTDRVVVPDGTDGQTMTVAKNDSVLSTGKWYEFDGKVSTLSIGGGLLYDFVTYIQDEESKEQISLKPDVKLRDFRFIMGGKLKTKRFISWKFGLMYDGVTTSWLVRETGVMVGLPEISSHVFVGRTKEGFSMNKVMNGYAGWTHERQMALDIIPILADGIKLLTYFPKTRMFWNAGIFADWLSEKQSFSTYAWQGILRLGWLPVLTKSQNTILHLGVNYRYGVPEDGKIRVRSRPESNPSPFFVDTGEFPAQHSNHIGWEAYFRTGPFMIGSEGYFTKFSSTDKDNPVFKGGEIGAAYILTGEKRAYNTVGNIYGFIPVRKSVFDGGPGTIEMILRYSVLDLNGGTITGGKMWRVTPMVNWYLSQYIRLELIYGYGVLDRFNLNGATQFFQSRIHLQVI